MNKNDWIEIYQPILNVNGEPIQFDVLEDLEEISNIPEEFIWSEIWDFDSERPWLVSGQVLDENGGLSWYQCEVPWVGSEQILIEWEED